MKEPERLTAAKTVENKIPKKNRISVRKLKYGSMATAITAVFIAIVIILTNRDKIKFRVQDLVAARAEKK